MKHIFIILLCLFGCLLSANSQNMGIRRMNGIPTAANYTPVGKDATVVYSETSKFLYSWNGTGWTQLSSSSGLNNTHTVSVSAPGYTPKQIGDIWQDNSSASSTKPTILTKVWTGSGWYNVTGNSQSTLNYDSDKGVLGLSVNGQPSTTNVIIPRETVGAELALSELSKNITSPTDTVYDVVIIGDSRTASGYTTDEFTKNLSNRFGYGGNGYYNWGEAISYGAQSHTNNGTIIDFTGDALYSPSGRALSLNANQVLEISMKSDSTGIVREGIFYYLAKPSAGQIELLIDNVVVQTISTASATIQVNSFTWTNTTKASNIKIRGRSTNTTPVIFLGMDLSARKKGVIVHRIGNSGATTTQFASINNYKYIKDVKPELVLIRLGVNGLTIDVNLQKTNLSTIIDSIRANSTAGIIIVGESANGLTPADSEDLLNSKYAQLALEKKVGYLSFKDINYNWAEFISKGYADVGDNVHENLNGGKVYGKFLTDYIFAKKTVREYNAKNIYDTPNGVSINNRSGIETLDATDENSVGVVASLGYKDSNGRGWFNINKVGGISNLTWFSRLNAPSLNYISTFALPQRQILVDNSAFYIRGTPTATAADVTVDFKDQLKIQNNGLLQLEQGYRFDSGLTYPAPQYFMGMGFYGEVTRRTIADTRTDLGIASIASGTNISNGTYTPTLSSFVNCSPAVSGLFTWSRSGNVVTVAGNVTLSATALGLFQFRISLPVASNFTANNDSAGNITGTEGYGVVFSNPTVDTAEALCRAKDSIATSTYTVVFQYQVK